MTHTNANSTFAGLFHRPQRNTSFEVLTGPSGEITLMMAAGMALLTVSLTGLATTYIMKKYAVGTLHWAVSMRATYYCSLFSFAFICMNGSLLVQLAYYTFVTLFLAETYVLYSDTEVARFMTRKSFAYNGLPVPQLLEEAWETTEVPTVGNSSAGEESDIESDNTSSSSGTVIPERYDGRSDSDKYDGEESLSLLCKEILTSMAVDEPGHELIPPRVVKGHGLISVSTAQHDEKYDINDYWDTEPIDNGMVFITAPTSIDYGFINIRGKYANAVYDYIGKVYTGASNKFVGYGVFVDVYFITLISLTAGAEITVCSPSMTVKPLLWKSNSGFAIYYVGTLSPMCITTENVAAPFFVECTQKKVDDISTTMMTTVTMKPDPEVDELLSVGNGDAMCMRTIPFGLPLFNSRRQIRGLYSGMYYDNQIEIAGFTDAMKAILALRNGPIVINRPLGLCHNNGG